ncbi:spore germination protein [Bacillus cereus]
MDFIMNMNEIVEYIEDDNYSPFPQFLLTERPDLVAAHLMEGGIALVLDNSSQILLAPVKFVSFFSNYRRLWFKVVYCFFYPDIAPICIYHCSFFTIYLYCPTFLSF